MKLFKFIRAAIIHNFVLSIVFKTAFIINLGIAVLKQAFFLVAWHFFFQKYTHVNGWIFNDLLLVCGLLSIGIGVVEILFFGLKDLPQIVETNALDRYLLQPQNLILNIALSRGQISSLGDVFTGVIAIWYGGFFSTYLLSTLLCIPLAIIFIFALYLYLGCISLYIKNSSEFIRELYRNSIIIASQPNSSYTGFLKILTITVLPVAFLSFFPVEFVKHSSYKYFFISYLGAIGFLYTSCIIFYNGIKRYESGNL
jgi:ABC-2 type transport system permease protein